MAASVGPWGWHRLDSGWVRRLIRAADVQPGDLVLDVGAGTGAITAQLADRGARVVAVELHPARAAALRARFAGIPHVTVVRADAADLRLPRRPFKVVANPPFAITTALLRRLTTPHSNLEVASIVVPAWAATRWACGRGVGGVSTRRRFHFAHGPRVPTRAFHPPAPGDAAFLVITSSQWRRP